MGNTMPDTVPARHRLLSEVTPTMAKADLKKVEADYRKRVGECIRRARKAVDWTLKELGGEIEKATGRTPDSVDTAQLSRWEAGTERPHFDALFAVDALRGSLLLELARLSDRIEVLHVIQIRRSA